MSQANWINAEMIEHHHKACMQIHHHPPPSSSTPFNSTSKQMTSFISANTCTSLTPFHPRGAGLGMGITILMAETQHDMGEEVIL